MSLEPLLNRWGHLQPDHCRVTDDLDVFLHHHDAFDQPLQIPVLDLNDVCDHGELLISIMDAIRSKGGGFRLFTELHGNYTATVFLPGEVQETVFLPGEVQEVERCSDLRPAIALLTAWVNLLEKTGGAP